MALGVRSDILTTVRAGFTHIQFAQPDDAKVSPVVAFLNSMEPSVSPYRKPDGSLTEAAIRGRDIFESGASRCSHCHEEPLFTSLRKADVGTAGASDQGERRFDTPSLVEIWRTPPYLHHGRAATLRDVIVTLNPDDQHGRTSHLSESEIDDLIEFLLSL